MGYMRLNFWLFLAFLGFSGVAVVGQKNTCKCKDITPPGDFNCAQQKKWDKCSVQWMVDGNFCADTCKRCKCEAELKSVCTDIAPNKQYTCAEQEAFGKCGRKWMIDGGFCGKTCGRCLDGDSVSFADSKASGPQSEDDENDDSLASDDMIVNLGSSLIDSFPNAANTTGQETKSVRTSDLETLADELLRGIQTPTKVDIIEVEVTAPATPALPPVLSSPLNRTLATPVRSRTPFNNVPAQDGENNDNNIVQTFAELEAMLEAAVIPPSPEPVEDVKKPCNDSIIDAIAARSDLTLLYSIVSEMNLNGLLEDPTLGVTFFAPDNKALNSLLEEENQDLSSILTDKRQLSKLQRLVLYHILPKSYRQSDLSSIAVSQTKLGANYPVFVEVSGRRTATIEGLHSIASITESDASTCGSVMHIVDHVLMPFEDLDSIPSVPFEVVADPLPASSPSPVVAAATVDEVAKVRDCNDRNAMQILSEYEGVEVFIQMLQKLGLVKQIQNSKTPFTLLVPRNDAIMEQLVDALNAKEGFEQLLTEQNSDLVTSILLYHIVEERLSLKDMNEDAPLKTRNGEMLFPEVRNKRDVSIQSLGSSAQIVAGDVDENACGFAIHFLDKVLLPFEIGTVTLNATSDDVQSDCTDEPLPGVSACMQVVAANLCNDLGVVEGDYCAKSCGRCTSLESSGALRKSVNKEEPFLRKPMGVAAAAKEAVDKEVFPTNVTCQTIPDILAANSNLSTVADLLGDNLLSILASPPAPITMFVPTNEAFEQLQKMADKKDFDTDDHITNILGYHIVEGFNTLASLTEGRLLNTMTGNEISGAPLQIRTHEEKSRFFVEALGMPEWAGVRSGDHIACRSVVHVIDRVLLPVSMH